MDILVTGGLGFIGSHFVEKQVQLGHQVVIWDSFTYAASLHNLPLKVQEKVTIEKIDISDVNATSAAISNHTIFDCIVNFAAESHVDRSILNPAIFFETNVMGVLNMLELYKQDHSKKFIQVSTDEVYGSISKGSWDESEPLDPKSPYAASKAGAELICNAYANTYDLCPIVTRSCNNFGTRQSVEKLIPKAISNILRGEPVTLYGSGLQRREWIYVNDNVDALSLILHEEQLTNHTLNIGGIELTNFEVATLLCEIMEKYNPQIEYVKDRPGHDFRYSVNDSLFRGKFKEFQNGDFLENLRTTVNWYIENPEWLSFSRNMATK
jgi:dTDP-glucose 4,6-dehydratase